MNDEQKQEMTPHPLLRAGAYYHIYNRANGRENLFREEANYIRFLELYNKYIPPVADTFAWVLMANHLHLLVRIREGMYYKYSKEDFSASKSSNAGRSSTRGASPSSNADRSSTRGASADAVGFEDVKWETIFIDPSASAGVDGIPPKRKKANPTNHFSHLFNAYAKYINEKYNRHGSLFQRPFRRKPVEDADYFQRIVLYIHNNPVHHGFVSHPSEYPWSSYPTFLSPEPTWLRRNAVLDWFGGIDRFREMHGDPFDYAATEAWLEADEASLNDVNTE